ncbi:MAG TPA: queuosine salvage family protein [Solirubrobacterales bacterium]
MADDVPNRVRTACAWVAGRSRSVKIAGDGIEAYAAALPVPAELPAPDPATHLVEGDREARAAFVVCLDAINFGSGWWPTIRKRPGHSGYFTIAAGLTERFREEGPWPARELTRLGPPDVAAALDQEAGHPLMAHYASALRDVGEHVLGDHGGRFEGLLDAAGGSAVALTGLLAEWEAFADVSTYDDRAVPFFKRAQIAAADLNRTGVAELGGEDRLTAFADNLVPHVLRLDGVLRLDSELERSIDAGELLEHGSPEEVELRACAVHAIELLSAATGGRLSPAQIDAALWNRGAEPRYKSVPRPRSRNTAY